MQRRRECVYGGGRRPRNEPGRNASGKGHDPGKLWGAEAKGRGPQRGVLAAEGTDHLDNVFAHGYSTYDTPSLILFLHVKHIPSFSQSGALAFLPEPSQCFPAAGPPVLFLLPGMTFSPLPSITYLQILPIFKCSKPLLV